MINLREFIDINFLGKHRLEKVQLIPLGETIEFAISIYGEPAEQEAYDELTDATQYTFVASPYHEAVITEWNQKIYSITYWSLKSDPARDLQYMLESYQENSSWTVMESGYWYQRMDEKMRLWCSAIPAIGIATLDFFTAKKEYKRSRCLEELKNLDDLHWAPSNAISEMQRLFTEGETSALNNFQEHSDRISISPNGRSVFIIRAHHAQDCSGGFMSQNTPPDDPNSNSTQVVNRYTWSEDGSSWSKFTLPRDANVEHIRFHGDECDIQIRRTSDDRIFNIKNSLGINIGLTLNDAKIWDYLEEHSQPDISLDNSH